MLQVNLIGFLGRDAEVKIFANGNERISFSLGVNARKDSPTVWFDVLFRRNDNLMPYLRKGTQVYVTGSCTMEQRGQYWNCNVNADNVCLLNQPTEQSPEETPGV